MNTSIQRINLWMGIVLATFSTSATAYYLFTLMAPYPVTVQWVSASMGASLEIARYSLTAARERVLPALLFIVSVGCSWAAMNTAFTQLNTTRPEYVLSELKTDRETALREAAEFERLNYKTKASEKRAQAAQYLERIEALETAAPAEPQALYWVNQMLMILLAFLIDITSVRCLLLATGRTLPREPEIPQNIDPVVPPAPLPQPEIPMPSTIPEPADPLLEEARELIRTGAIRQSKNALKTHFGIGWDRANKLFTEIQNDSGNPET